jgi:hypothetical protein
MAEAPAAPALFDVAAAGLAGLTALSSAEARGTLRLVCRDAGLRTDLVTLPKMRVLITRLLPREIAARGVGEPDAVCKRLLDQLEQAQVAPAPSDPAELFRRIRAG